MKFRSFTQDAFKKPKKKQFKTSSAAEVQFKRALKKVARVSGYLVEKHVKGTKIERPEQLKRALESYSELLGPWAEAQSLKMIEKVNKANARAVANNAKTMSQIMQAELLNGDIGRVAMALMNEQVALIKSIPLEAGERAQKLALESFTTGARADEIAKELMRTTEVTESRATLIAVTETARANASISQARALNAGASGYIWRTTMDGAERESHAKMNGKYVEYKNPPHLSDGTTGHAGTFPNCRCYQDPVFDD